MRDVKALAFLLARVAGAALLCLFAILALGAVGIAADHQQDMAVVALAIIGVVAWRTPAAFRQQLS